MKAVVKRNIQSPEILNHDLAEHFPALARFENSADLKKSELYQRLEPEIEKLLYSVVGENFAPSLPVEAESEIRALAWNIGRGRQLQGILNVLENHPDLSRRDLLLLTELDYGMARSENLFVAREIAQKLKLNYVFAPCYLALNKGSGVEADVEGENRQAIHGLALFSRFPIIRAEIVSLPPGKDKMRGKEKRIGCLKAVIAEIDHPAGRFLGVTIHLDAHSNRAHGVFQMGRLLEALNKYQPELPAIIGGDWNTTTHNAQNARRAIMGYWRRVMMGPRNVAENHYPHPERFFERELFKKLEENGFSYKDFNNLGVGTLHYDMNNLATNTNLGDWVPSWCFPWIFWAMEKVGGRCSLRLDWFAGRNIKTAEDSSPKVVGNLNDNGTPLSDHDPIVLDFKFNI